MPKSHKARPSLLTTVMRKDFRTIGVTVLAVLALLDFAVPHHGNFALDGTFGFAAWFGAFACFALVLLALAAGSLLRRPEATYDD